MRILVHNKIILILSLLFVFSSCTTRLKNDNKLLDNNIKVTNQQSTITYNGSLYKKSRLIHSVSFENSIYHLFTNLVNPDTTKNYTWSATSLAIYNSGIFKKNLFTKDLFLSMNDLKDYAYNIINITTIYSDEKKKLIRLNFDCSPCAPGNETISLIQFKETQITHSKQYSIIGEFINNNEGVNGLAWSGYFAYELPFKLTEKNNELKLEIDTLNILRENNFYFLNITDGVRFASGASELIMTDDPFNFNPSTIKVNLKPKTKVTLIHMAVDQVEDWNYFLTNSWVKIKINDKQGWIKSDNDLIKIGCQAAG